MYLTGTKYDFISRFHQFGESDATSNNFFLTEARTYIAGLTSYDSGKWENEASRRAYLLSGNAADFNKNLI